MNCSASALLSVLLLAACAAPQPQVEYVWRKSNVTQQDYTMDRGQCRVQSMSAAGAPNTQVTPTMQSNRNLMSQLMHQGAIFDACMEGKGWALSPK